MENMNRNLHTQTLAEEQRVRRSSLPISTIATSPLASLSLLETPLQAGLATTNITIELTELYSYVWSAKY